MGNLTPYGLLVLGTTLLGAVAALVAIFHDLPGAWRTLTSWRKPKMPATTEPNTLPYLAMSEAAQRIGCQGWHIRTIYNLGLLPTVRCAGQRLIPPEHLPELERLVRARYFDQKGRGRRRKESPGTPGQSAG